MANPSLCPDVSSLLYPVKVLEQALVWLESTALARSIGESLAITAWLSASHAVGFTLIMSGGLVWNLRASELLLEKVPADAFTKPALWLLGSGLAISLTTGILLFAPRASYIAALGAFQLKITLLILAVIWQSALMIRAQRKPAISAVRLRSGGVIGSLWWLSLAVTACWFILFE